MKPIAQSVLIAAGWLLLASGAVAQCFVMPDGRRICTPRPSITAGRPGGHVVHPPGRSPATETELDPTVCRVLVDEGGGTGSVGTGVIVEGPAGFAFVLTAEHVVRDRKSISVEFTDGAVYRTAAELLDADPQRDLALLKIKVPPKGKVRKLANEDPGQNDPVFTAGYHDGTRFAAYKGVITGLGSPVEEGPPDWFSMNTGAGPGFSGGPCFSEDGRVCGIVWGGENRAGKGWATRVSVIRRRFPILRRVLDLPAAVIRGPSRPATCAPPQSTPPSTIHDPQSTIQAAFARLEKRLDQQQQAVAGLHAAIGKLQLQAGPQGPQGPRGPPGNDGSGADPGRLSELERRLIALESKTILVQTRSADGRVLEEAVIRLADPQPALDLFLIPQRREP